MQIFTVEQYKAFWLETSQTDIGCAWPRTGRLRWKPPRISLVPIYQASVIHAFTRWGPCTEPKGKTASTSATACLPCCQWQEILKYSLPYNQTEEQLYSSLLIKLLDLTAHLLHSNVFFPWSWNQCEGAHISSTTKSYTRCEMTLIWILNLEYKSGWNMAKHFLGE